MTGYAEFSGKNNQNVPDEENILRKPFSRLLLLEKVRGVIDAVPGKLPSGTTLREPA